MKELEQALVMFLEKIRGNRDFIDVSLRDIRDALGSQFIADGRYKMTELNSAINAIVRDFRSMNRMRWIATGQYYYALNTSLPAMIEDATVERPGNTRREVGRFNPLARQDAVERQSIDLGNQHFSSVAQLASSPTFLVMDLSNCDFELLSGVSI
jgi:hypothetical protein